MRVVLIALIVLASCKTYEFAASDFPEPIIDSNYTDTLQVTFGHGLVQDSGFTLQFKDTVITQALLDSLINEDNEKRRKQDSIKNSKKII